MRYHANCLCGTCNFSLETDDYEMRGVLVDQHRMRTGHTVKMTDDPEPTVGT